VTGADNQQERLFVAKIPEGLGNFLAGFALGEASFMIVCRRHGDYARSWKLSAAFNVSQTDRAPLDLFLETLACGSMREAGNGGWYWEVNRLSEIRSRIVPFFRRSSARRPTTSSSSLKQRSCSHRRRWRTQTTNRFCSYGSK
jgi:hypothetical protein